MRSATEQPMSKTLFDTDDETAFGAIRGGTHSPK